MAFTYDGTPDTSERDWLRFMIGDTNEDTAMLQDAEIVYILNNYSTKRAQLAIAYRQCANHLAAKTVKRKLGPQSEDGTERMKYYARMAKHYENTAYSGTPPLPSYASEKVFDKNRMANEV